MKAIHIGMDGGSDYWRSNSNHMVCIVAIDGQEYQVDVGFGRYVLPFRIRVEEWRSLPLDHY